MIRALRYNIPINDEEFDKIYPLEIQNLSERHWTPVNIAQNAAKFLVSKPGVKVLDIGSGVGKFCIVGSLVTSGVFYGVEQRKRLADISEKLVKDYKIRNMHVICSNITTINFKEFDAFYFYNSFYENIERSSIIDNKVSLSFMKYIEYRKYLQVQLSNMPAGTRVVTYSGFDADLPPGYRLIRTEENNNLKYWMKDALI